MSSAMRMRVRRGRRPPPSTYRPMSTTPKPLSAPVRLDRYGPEGRSAWMDVDWREHQRWVTVAGAPMNVIELGSGPPVVFVHGLAGSRQNWLEQLVPFSDDHRVVVMDLPGFGASPMPPDEISIPGYGRLLDGLMDALEIDACAVVGNSMGGFIAAELAIRFPHRLEKLVLVSAAGISSEQLMRRPLLTGARMAAAGAAWAGANADWLTRRPRMRRLMSWTVMRHPDRLPAPLVAEQVKGSGKPGFIDAFDSLMSYRIRDRLPEIRVPTLIAWGADDRLVPVRDADEFERLIPNSRKVVFDDTGHMPQLERPEAFNELLRDFIA